MPRVVSPRHWRMFIIAWLQDSVHNGCTIRIGQLVQFVHKIRHVQGLVKLQLNVRLRTHSDYVIFTCMRRLPFLRPPPTTFISRPELLKPTDDVQVYVCIQHIPRCEDDLVDVIDDDALDTVGKCFRGSQP